MSRAENRHHKQRVIRNRVKELKQKWHNTAKDNPEWVLKTAQHKDNPFTRCSCDMCQNAFQERAENKQDRKAAKQSIKNEEY